MYVSRRCHRLLQRRYRSRSFRYLVLVLPIVLWLGYQEVKNQLDQPQAIFVLGGSTQREKFAAKFARQHPDLPIWVSGGSPKSYAEPVFAKAGIDRSRLKLDYRAVDTVTNFTTLVDEFQTRGIKKIYLVTSDYHMHRAQIIGDIVLGSRGIEIQPVAVPTSLSPEPIEKVIRDGARSVLWVVTGHTGATLTKKGE